METRKYVSPTVAFLMGLFMFGVALVYISIITEYWDMTKVDIAFRLFIGIPAFGLVIYGCGAMIWANIMRDRLEFSEECDAWVMKH